jgi:hypothetical protein
MAGIIDRRHIAILYETITGQCQKRGSISIDGDDKLDLDSFLASHPGLAAVIVPRKAHPGSDHNEHFCRQAIANATGAPYFPHGADRAVMVHPEGHVVSIHYGNVHGLDHPDTGHQLISHSSADIGDEHLSGRKFLRKYEVVHKETGQVERIITALVDEPVDILPTSPLADHDIRILSIPVLVE